MKKGPHIARASSFGLPGKVRTCDLLIPNQAPYRLGYGQMRTGP